MTKILLNNSEYQFTQDKLPCLIHGKEGSGASLFSITMMANFFYQDEKILFICAYPMAREEMEKQTNVIGGVNIIYITGETEPKISNMIDSITDIGERIVMLKNVETFPRSVFEKLKNHKNIVFSGDLDQCEFKDELLNLELKAKINFANYEGEMESGEIVGSVKLQS